MKIATFVYQKVLDSSGARRKVWNLARAILIRIFRDPTCILLIHGRLLKLPLSHALPAHLKNHEHYDQLPGRISQYLHQTQGKVCCIDVGANIGDSVAAFYKHDKDLFLAIEPNPKFYKFLATNWSGNKNITTVDIICSSESTRETFTIQEQRGTASILPTKNGATMTRQPLDTIVNNFLAFKDTNLLKIDTDGHDFEVIAGAKMLFSRNQPVVLFECDAFANKNYIEDCLKALKLFLVSGYNYFLLYDNFGQLMGKYPLADLFAIRGLLFFQLTSPFHYFDMLVMKDTDIDCFFKTEVDYFVDKMPDKSLQLTARIAIEL